MKVLCLAPALLFLCLGAAHAKTDYYGLLAIEETATAREVKSACRRLSILCLKYDI